jgi:dihydrofolate reductase
MIISTIVACAQGRVIGRDNQIPWYLPADLRYFQKKTSGHHIIMGRNCFESIGRALPKRTNVIVTRNPFYLAADCLVVHSVKEALQIAKKSGETEAFIIGGGEIYRQTAHLWDRIYLTEVDLNVEGDVFFPEIDLSNYQLTFEEAHKADEKNEFDYVFKIYEKKN